MHFCAEKHVLSHVAAHASVHALTRDLLSPLRLSFMAEAEAQAPLRRENAGEKKKCGIEERKKRKKKGRIHGTRCA